MTKTKQETHAETAYFRLFELAALGGDGFRQWYYPGLPKNYDINPKIVPLITEIVANGGSAEDAYHAVLAAYREDEDAWLLNHAGQIP